MYMHQLYELKSSFHTLNVEVSAIFCTNIFSEAGESHFSKVSFLLFNLDQVKFLIEKRNKRCNQSHMKKKKTYSCAKGLGNCYTSQ